MAYLLYLLQRGKLHGHDLEDWLAAEALILSELIEPRNEGGITTMAKKNNDLISFPMRVSQEVERMFDEMIHRPWGFCRGYKGMESIRGPLRN